MKENDTNIIIVTESEGIYWEVGLMGQITRRKYLEIFSRFKNFVEENRAEKMTLELISVSKMTWLICSRDFLCIFQKQ
jgi:hypothetical protein